MSYVFPISRSLRYRLGIVPHFVDYNHPTILCWKRRFGEDVLIIDVLRPPKAVIYDITQCEHILSSSLHGLIIADSYNIPNMRFAIRETMSHIHDYKYLDYYTALGIPHRVLEITGNESLDALLLSTRSNGLHAEPVMKRLNAVFLRLRDSLLGWSQCRCPGF
jgi:pyruvyltransferase